MERLRPAEVGSVGGTTAHRRTGSGETHKERVDRELLELLNELRVALPGVQFLFAFLLVVPYSQGRDDLTDFQRSVYFVALLAAAVATGLLIAPAAQHRVLFRQSDKDQLLRRSNRSALGGLVVLVVAICAALLLVVDTLYSRSLAWAATGAVGALLIWWWIAVPFWRRAHTEQEDVGADDVGTEDGDARDR